MNEWVGCVGGKRNDGGRESEISTVFSNNAANSEHRRGQETARSGSQKERCTWSSSPLKTTNGTHLSLPHTHTHTHLRATVFDDAATQQRHVLFDGF